MRCRLLCDPKMHQMETGCGFVKSGTTTCLWLPALSSRNLREAPAFACREQGTRMQCHPKASRLQGFSLFLAYQVCNCWQPQAKMSWTCHEVSVRRARCNTVPTLGIVGFIRLMGDILHPLGPVGILMLLQTLRFMGYYRLVQDFVHQLFCDRREEVGFMLQD